MSISKFEQSLAAAKARGGKNPPSNPSPNLPATPKQLSLELWPDAVRGVPNSVLRGALFGVSKVRKHHKKRTLIAATENYEIRFKGESFNQRDFDVFQTMLHLAMPHPLGTRVEFYVGALLKQLGRKTSGVEHEDFKNQMMRLIGGAVEIYSVADKVSFVGTLVQSAKRDDETGRYVVKFDQDMLTLFQTGFTLIDWGQRQALGNNAIAQWLQGFYASHAAPYAYKVETLHNLCGSTSTTKEFKRLLKAALDRMIEVGALTKWGIDADDLVTVSRRPSASQAKHITKTKVSRIVRRLTPKT
jgi:hypothetical protein